MHVGRTTLPLPTRCDWGGQLWRKFSDSRGSALNRASRGWSCDVSRRLQRIARPECSEYAHDASRSPNSAAMVPLVPAMPAHRHAMNPAAQPVGDRLIRRSFANHSRDQLRLLAVAADHAGSAGAHSMFQSRVSSTDISTDCTRVNRHAVTV
jgi:hypothetical protein